MIVLAFHFYLDRLLPYKIKLTNTKMSHPGCASIFNNDNINNSLY